MIVKLRDPFSGYLLAYGDSLLHFGYFIALCIVPKSESCDKADYVVSWKLLLSSHIIVSILGIIKSFFKAA